MSRRLLRAALSAGSALALASIPLLPATIASASPLVASARHATPRAATAHHQASGAAKHRTSRSGSGTDPISPIYQSPSPALLSEGKTLFDENCSSCHGLNGQGSSLAPNLRGLGAGIPYLWVVNGWMPLANPTAQPISKPPLFNHHQIVAIASYVGSFVKGKGLPIYSVDLSHANLAEGLSVFALNCAPCHTITGVGDALSNGQFAPSLHGVYSSQVALAVRSGPGNMPVFSKFIISDRQLADLAKYITNSHDSIKHPRNAGGLGLGGVGPVAEGFVALFIGVGGCIVGALWIGERAEDEEGGGPGRREPGPGDRQGGPPHGSDPEVIHV